jgi:septation ring formation regulator EzrA
MKTGGVIATIVVAVVLSVAVTSYMNNRDKDRIENIERTVTDFRKETQDNFDTLREEVLRNREAIGQCQGKLDTVIAGEVVIYNQIKSLDKEDVESNTPHDFLSSLTNFLGF